MDLLLLIVNLTLAFLNFLVNVFFSYCLAFSSEKTKQPLKILLELMISCSILYLVSMSMKLILRSSFETTLVFYFLSNFTLATSMTSSVWLCVFYFTQIVPAERALSIWIKKNIKSVIYSAFVCERLLSVADIVLEIVKNEALFSVDVTTNTTTYLEMATSDLQGAVDLNSCMKWIIAFYLSISTCAMVMANASISWYLIQHVQRMSTNGQCLSCPTVRGQLRVAVTCMVQGVLYMFSAQWLVYIFVNYQLFYIFVDFYVNITVINVYMLGTSLNMWVGQTVFRQRTVDIIQALQGKLLARRGDGGDETVKT